MQNLLYEGVDVSKFSQTWAKIGSNLSKFWKNRVILLIILPKIKQIGIWMGHFFLKNWYLYGSTFKFHSGTSPTKTKLEYPRALLDILLLVLWSRRVNFQEDQLALYWEGLVDLQLISVIFIKFRLENLWISIGPVDYKPGRSSVLWVRKYTQPSSSPMDYAWSTVGYCSASPSCTQEGARNLSFFATYIYSNYM